MPEDLYNIVKEEVKVVNIDEGGFHSWHLWKLNNKLRAKNQNNPTAVVNKDGKLITFSVLIWTGNHGSLVTKALSINGFQYKINFSKVL